MRLPLAHRARAALLLIFLWSGALQAAPKAPAAPHAASTDPARDTRHPAANQDVQIPSGGVAINGLMMLAAGDAPKPTLLLMHGLPGNEQNLDLAQAVRRAGWNVLTIHYRGSWGSPGTFSITHSIEDAGAAMAFLRQPDNAAQYHIDTRRLVIGGHSMGGLAAAKYGATHDDVAVLLLDPWNAGADAQPLRSQPSARAEAVQQLGADLGPIAGIDGEGLTAELEHHADDWDLLTLAPQLAERPTLIVGAEYGNGADNRKLSAAIQAQHKGRIQNVTLSTDHAFADHRIALAEIVVDWLQALPAPR